MTAATATPQLDRALAVRDVSVKIGEFVMEHLAEQGIVLARWMWEQAPCPYHWTIRDGEPMKLLSGWSQRDTDQETDVYECPCDPPEIPEGRPTHTYKHARWSLVQFHRSEGWIGDELARFFGIDPVEMERERAVLLASLQNGQ